MGEFLSLGLNNLDSIQTGWNSSPGDTFSRANPHAKLLASVDIINLSSGEAVVKVEGNFNVNIRSSQASASIFVHTNLSDLARCKRGRANFFRNGK